jgi:hypothetical protein
MRVIFILGALLATTAAAPAQDAVSSGRVSTPAQNPPAQRATPTVPPATGPLPVSLERIRELLAQPAPLQQSLERRPTFRIEVEEQQRLQDLLATLNVERPTVPPPAGGATNYETQRVLLQSLGRPMMQPYAAFNGKELLTIAFENLIGKYLGWMAVDAVTAADRARAEAAARAEVTRAVAAYCAGLPNGGAGAELCTRPVIP